ncbi:hypothetical protein K491DRAFT_597275 [Lophiostoma macrostomum CBS 122681]|uniref:Transglycosylase SLT domain-containing protein n=1 Tax=Lophiostoma macrostomum CBS 122681 TaxID=1314788 RepID=A0A6A6TAG5_9PLEO|nr:hypothetical protein K491DRAFT_597275 [Lophiostoma macrostomum CBS 122681]
MAGSLHQATAAPTPSSDLASIGQQCGQWYSGPASNFPAYSSWLDFTTLFNLNKNNMLSTGDTGEDVGRIWNAINSAAASIGVEERVILSIILQESNGDVGVPCTTAPDGSGSCGLMQADGSPGFQGQHGLSQDDINNMVNAGTQHYKSNLEQQGNGDDAQTIYEALRLYNSGSVDTSNLSNGLGATDSYVSDIANRLTGVVC